MEYLAVRRFNRQGVCSYSFDIVEGSSLEKRDDGLLYFDGRPVCFSRSKVAHDYFVRNNDGNGRQRFYLSHAIIEALGGIHREKTREWEAVMHDPVAVKYRNKSHVDYWLWDDSFFNASIEDLVYIANLVGIDIAKEVESSV